MTGQARDARHHFNIGDGWQLVPFKSAASALEVEGSMSDDLGGVCFQENVTFNASEGKKLTLSYRSSTGEGKLHSPDGEFVAWGLPGKPSVIMFGKTSKTPAQRILQWGYLQRLDFPVVVEDTLSMHEVSVSLGAKFTQVQTIVSQANARITHADNTVKKYADEIKQALTPGILERFGAYGDEGGPCADLCTKRKEREALGEVAGEVVKKMNHLLSALAEPKATTDATRAKINTIFDTARDLLMTALTAAGADSDAGHDTELEMFFKQIVPFLRVADKDLSQDNVKTKRLYMDRIAKLQEDEHNFSENGADPELFQPYKQVLEEITSLSSLVCTIDEKENMMSVIMASAGEVEAKLDATPPSPPKKRRRASFWNAFGLGA